MSDALAEMTSARDCLRAEVGRLEEKLEDITESFSRVVNSDCAPDEKHCSCVPALRAKIEELERLLAGGK